LEPADDIKTLDRTFKLIKDRLLKAVIERSKRLAEEENVSDQDSQEWAEEEGSENMLDSFHPMKRKQPREELASSDEEEYASYQKKFQDHTE
jgi:hypothetical protein